MASTQFARGQFSKAQQRFAIKIGKALTRGNHLQKLRFIGRKIPARIRQRLHHFPLKRQHRRLHRQGSKAGEQGRLRHRLSNLGAVAKSSPPAKTKNAFLL